MNRYPKEIYSPREDVTRANMREYDKKKELVYKKCLELNSNYYSLPFREKVEIYRQAQDDLGIRL